MAEKIHRVGREIKNAGYKSFLFIGNDGEYSEFISSVDMAELERVIERIYKLDEDIRRVITSAVLNNTICGRPPSETTKPGVSRAVLLKAE